MGNTELQSNMDRSLTLRVNRVYDRRTVQGEGPYMGRLCTFVRLWGCNLHCVWCDSAETWDTHGRNLSTPRRGYPKAENCVDMEIPDIVASVSKLGVPLVILTGGEPLLQMNVGLLAWELSKAGMLVHVETNGTLSPAPFEHVDYFVVSPKLESAGAGPRSIDTDALANFAYLASRGWAAFKFVCRSAADVEDVAGLARQFQIDPATVWIMPEGISSLAVKSGLVDLADAALEHGYNLSGRLHVDIWGTDRGR